MGKYPYPDTGAQIAMVMMLTEGELPLPPRDGTFTPEFHDFIERCVVKDPQGRASAMELLESDWLAMHGATSLDVCQEVVCQWLEEMGFKDEYAQYRKPVIGAAAGAAGVPVVAGGAGASATDSKH